MRYQITLIYKERGVPGRTSVVDRGDDTQARDAAERWARLVSNAAGSLGPKPRVWWLCRLGEDDVYHPFDAGEVHDTDQK